MTPLDWARTYTQAGWRVVPIPFRQKGCRVPGWCDLRLDGAGLDGYFADRRVNIGVLLGEPSGWLVDVDLDCAEAIELAPQYLPPGAVRFGHASKPRSHWLYVAPGTLSDSFKEPPVGVVKVQTLLEVRSTRLATVFPGSVHTSGEPISFEGGLFPPAAAACVPAPVLRQAVADLAASTLRMRSAAHAETPRLAENWARWGCSSPPTPAARACREVAAGATDLESAVEAFRRDHPLELPRRRGRCPICGHDGCFGSLRAQADRWSCFSSGHVSVGRQAAGCWWGDSLDLHAAQEGVSRTALLVHLGYLAPSARPNYRRSS